MGASTHLSMQPKSVHSNLSAHLTMLSASTLDLTRLAKLPLNRLLHLLKIFGICRRFPMPPQTSERRSRAS